MIASDMWCVLLGHVPPRFPPSYIHAPHASYRRREKVAKGGDAARGIGLTSAPRAGGDATRGTSVLLDQYSFNLQSGECTKYALSAKICYGTGAPLFLRDRGIATQKKGRGCNTRTSQEVTHPSTTLAQARLTSKL